MSNLPPPLPLAVRRSSFRWWFVPLGLLALLMLLAFAGLVYIGVAGSETYVTPGSRVRPWHKAKLEKMAGLATNETIRFFYSGAVLDITSEGEMLTDRAVYSWLTDEGELAVSRAAFDEIAEIEVEQGTSFFDDTMVTLTLTNDDTIYMLLPIEHRGDEKFVDALRKSMQEANRARKSDAPEA